MNRFACCVPLALAFILLSGCSSPSAVKPEPTSSERNTVASAEVTSGVTLEAAIDQTEFAAGTSTTTTVTLRNTTDTSQTVYDIKGIRVLTPEGSVVSDPTAGVIYPSVSVVLAPGETRVIQRKFLVPEPGAYLVQAFLWESGQPPSQEPSATVAFTSVEP